MTTTELIELLKKYEVGGATGRPLVDKIRFHKCFPAEKALREDATK